MIKDDWKTLRMYSTALNEVIMYVSILKVLVMLGGLRIRVNFIISDGPKVCVQPGTEDQNCAPVWQAQVSQTCPLGVCQDVWLGAPPKISAKN